MKQSFAAVMLCESNRTRIIAEAGVNHNGDMEIARRLIDAAAAAGADYCKFQSFNADNLVSRTAPKARYQEKTDVPAESQHEMLRRLELTEADHVHLMAHCAQSKIRFLSTPFDENSALLLQRLGLQTLKIPSGELTNLPFLRFLSERADRFYLSTGMGNLKEVEQALRALGWPKTNRQITILHCTTQYPTPDADINLRALETLRREFGLPVGLSDHSCGLEASLCAVALGATVVEKHFTLDRNLPGPDHAASIETTELAQLVFGIRRIELMLGDGHKSPRPSERENIAVARKSIHTTRPVLAGETFSSENLGIKRPGDGIRLISGII